MALRRNVLIFHQAALGDFIVTWPLAVALGRTFPQSRLFYVTASEKGKLAEDVLRVESTDVELGWHALFAEDAAPAENVRQRLEGAHTIISFVSDGNDAWARNVRRLAPDAALIPLVTRPPADDAADPLPPTLRPPAALAGHVTVGLLQQLRDHLPIAAALAQILASVCDRGIGHRPKADDAIVIHPGGGNPEKCWPVARYVELIERLRADPAPRPVHVLLGEVEIDRWPAQDVAALRAVADVRSLATLAELLKEIAGSLFIGNDSGPGHLAAIVGLPTLTIFGHDHWQAWRPLGPAVNILAGTSLDAVSVDQAYEAVHALGAGTR